MTPLDNSQLASATGGTRALPPNRPGIPPPGLLSPLTSPWPGPSPRPLPSPQPMPSPNPFPITAQINKR